MSEASKEAICLKNFIGDLGIVPSIKELTEIFFDNESLVTLTKEPGDQGILTENTISLDIE